MRESNPRSGRATDKTDSQLDIPEDAITLGTDQHGAKHYFSRDTHTVTVVNTSDLIDKYDLSSYSLTTWVTVIAQERGWRELSNAEMFTEILADTVEAY